MKFSKWNNPSKRRYKKHYDKTEADIIASKRMLDDRARGVEMPLETYEYISDKLQGKEV
jgi:hypothetical protein